MKVLWMLVISGLLVGFGLAMYWPHFAGIKGVDQIEQPRQAPYLEPDVKIWQDYLYKVVTDDGWVDYEQAMVHRRLLQEFLQQVAEATPAQFPSDQHRLAFYINSYNALTIEGVLRHWPISSVSDVGRMHYFFRERVYRVAGATVSLHGFESKLIRNYDPLMHFALNCASASCPKLSRMAYVPQQLTAQLETRAKMFIEDTAFNRYDSNKAHWQLSQIFEWYEDDFGGWQGVVGVLKRFSPYNFSSDVTHAYIPYDWSLNQAKKSTP